MVENVRKAFYEYIVSSQKSGKLIDEGTAEQKIFSLDTMNELVEGNSFLKNQYEKIKNLGRKLFGYHSNEIILSFIFMKYVINDPELFERYKVLKTRVDHEKQSAKGSAGLEKEDLEEQTMFGTFGTGFPVMPGTFKANQASMKATARDMRRETPTVIRGKMQQVVESFLDMDTILSILNEEYVNPEQVVVTEINGVPVDKFLSNMSHVDYNELPKEMTVDFHFKRSEFGEDVEYSIVVNYWEFLRWFSDRYFDNLTDGNQLNHEFTTHLLTKPLADYITKNIAQAKPLGKLDTAQKITDIPQEMKENLNEKVEARPSALVQLDQIHADNAKYEKEFISGLNKGIQKEISNPKDGGNFEYDYVNGGHSNSDNTKNESADAFNDYVALNRGRGMQDWDFSLNPSDKWWKRLKDSIGEDQYKLMLHKAKLRKMERLGQKDAEVLTNQVDWKDRPTTKGQPPKLNESIDRVKLTEQDMEELKAEVVKEMKESKRRKAVLKEHVEKLNLNENLELKGFYTDVIKDLRNITVIPGEALLCEGVGSTFVKIKVEGLGNNFLSTGKPGKGIPDQERISLMEAYDFYFDLSTDQVYKTFKKGPAIDENGRKQILKEFNDILNYNPNKYVSNKLNNKARTKSLDVL